jgi:hypothetical protein
MTVRPADAAVPPLEPPVDPDWTALFREAGLDQSRFESAAPTRNPAVHSETRAAWIFR